MAHSPSCRVHMYMWRPPASPLCRGGALSPCSLFAVLVLVRVADGVGERRVVLDGLGQLRRHVPAHLDLIVLDAIHLLLLLAHVRILRRELRLVVADLHRLRSSLRLELCARRLGRRLGRRNPALVPCRLHGVCLHHRRLLIAPRLHLRARQLARLLLLRRKALGVLRVLLAHLLHVADLVAPLLLRREELLLPVVADVLVGLELGLDVVEELPVSLGQVLLRLRDLPFEVRPKVLALLLRFFHKGVDLGLGLLLPLLLLVLHVRAAQMVALLERLARSAGDRRLVLVLREARHAARLPFLLHLGARLALPLHLRSSLLSHLLVFPLDDPAVVLGKRDVRHAGRLRQDHLALAAVTPSRRG
mmetsp:Transcript_4450/g.11719  ORF Transcript_4450/g.11719 Transcript_4450/m.11719 type:complete len:361 (-) Transcript_4450:63-1145(-)